MSPREEKLLATFLVVEVCFLGLVAMIALAALGVGR